MNISSKTPPNNITGDKKLSALETTNNIFNATVKEFTTFDLNNPIDSAIRLSNKAYQLLKHEGNSENFYKKGFLHGVKFEDPTLSEIFDRHPDWLHDSEKKQEMIAAMEMIIKGYSLATIQPFIDEIKSIVIRHKRFFENYRGTTHKKFLHDILKLHTLHTLRQNETTTISEWVTQHHLLQKLQQSYHNFKTLDARKAAEDHLKKIEKNRKGGIFFRAESDELYSEGYALASKSENPPIVQLIGENYFPVYEQIILRFNTPFSWGFDAVAKLSAVISGIANGYAAVFYERYLQQELKNLNETTPDTHATEEYTQQVPLKWNGDKEDMYSLIRQLIEEDLVSNTPAELALFLKRHVDIFHDSTSQEILKALSTNK